MQNKPSPSRTEEKLSRSELPPASNDPPKKLPRSSKMLPPGPAKKKPRYQQVTNEERTTTAAPSDSKAMLALLSDGKSQGRMTKKTGEAIVENTVSTTPKPSTEHWIVELVILVSRMPRHDRASDEVTAQQLGMPLGMYQALKKDIKSALAPGSARILDGVQVNEDRMAAWKLFRFIALAERALDVKYYSLTYMKIAEALVEAKESRGVAVRVLLDKTQAMGAPEGEVIKYLRAHGIYPRYCGILDCEILEDGKFAVWGTANGSEEAMEGGSSEYQQYVHGITGRQKSFDISYAGGMPDERVPVAAPSQFDAANERALDPRSLSPTATCSQAL